ATLLVRPLRASCRARNAARFAETFLHIRREMTGKPHSSRATISARSNHDQAKFRAVQEVLRIEKREIRRGEKTLRSSTDPYREDTYRPPRLLARSRSSKGRRNVFLPSTGQSSHAGCYSADGSSAIHAGK